MEFTKQELEDIQIIYKTFCSGDEPRQLTTLEQTILHKLEIMIANHCTHDWEETYRTCEVSYCTKCGEETC
jgi:hypothetical protein